MTTVASDSCLYEWSSTFAALNECLEMAVVYLAHVIQTDDVFKVNVGCIFVIRTLCGLAFVFVP